MAFWLQYLHIFSPITPKTKYQTICSIRLEIDGSMQKVHKEEAPRESIYQKKPYRTEIIYTTLFQFEIQ